MKTIVIIAALAALSAEAAPRRHGPMVPHHSHPTNSFVVEGVEMPPKYTEEEWARRQEFVDEFHRRLGEMDGLVHDRWFASLTREQRDALDAERQRLTKEQEERQAALRRRQWEMEGVTNRLAWVKSEARTKRRIEREFHHGLKWMDSDLVKETVTIGESGKVKIHILYTADGKRHRFDPESIERELGRKALAAKIDTIVKED